MADCSGTPLWQKLGIKAGAIIVLIKEPANYQKLLGRFPAGVGFSDRIGTNVDFIHLFTTRHSDLEKQLAHLRRKLADSGTLWVSWPKKSAGVATDVTEDVIRAVACHLDSWIQKCVRLTKFGRG